MKVKINEEGADKRKFDPIKLNISIRIDTEQELDELREEFFEGEFQDYSTQYSDILFRVINDLEMYIKNR